MPVTALHWYRDVAGITGVLLLLAALHPFLTYPISLAMSARRKAFRFDSPPMLNQRPTLAICLSVYNEERVIVSKVSTLLAMARDYGPATVHVYVDGANDRTVELLRPFADQIDLVISPDRRGKTIGVNALVSRSSSDLIAFTDANVIAPPYALLELSAPFQEPTVGCATARLEYCNDVESATSSAGSTYWRVEEMLKKIESETVGVIGVDGAFFVVRREIYEPAPATLIDDLYTTLVILMKGYQVISVDHVVVQERSAVHWREEFHRKRRIACQAFNVHRALWPRIRAMPKLVLYAYISHRLMKWLMPFVLFASLSCLLTACVLTFGWLPMLTLGGALVGTISLTALSGWRPAQFALSTAVSILGVALGVLSSVFLHKTYAVWIPAASVRD